ncbi:hypothetical protein [Flavobacterium gawalongense]|uniref:Uncharacterized protein n=1 Tax=Flavobacterium gawalongense TaxID=2594432 RepID=A0A553BBE6_9FLAO|nr:hypothetical protein [Flavobacterium gawalongense]TRX05567.1 hypothetical protein FNW11_15910 [Flavobacterium gawalongense]TRX06408.1 hypothetical protein FNW10_15965 [Flavobacterium gawalongense]TRX22330.1 hypothetical protein FNW38_16000 [Flavobacterium gawalongense]
MLSNISYSQNYMDSISKYYLKDNNQKTIYFGEKFKKSLEDIGHIDNEGYAAILDILSSQYIDISDFDKVDMLT